jgi:2',3'-cyclic-nucleotide 2'-phosphodiesterase (5'-nucleotidase family)
VHGRLLYDEANKFIGASRLSGYVSKLRAENRNILLIDAGDILHGQTIVTLSKGKVAAEVMNLVGYNYFVPGNHDFNYGYQRLLELTKSMKFDVLSANIVFLNGKFPFKRNDIIKIDDKKIGIFGLTTPETSIKTNPQNTKEIIFIDPIKAANKEIIELRKKDVDLIIAITHLGVDNESFGHRSYDLRDKTLGIDLIIDGHSHTKLKKIDQIINRATIVSTGAYLEYVGIVDLSIIDGAKIINPESIHFDNFKSQKPDPVVERFVKKASSEVSHLLDKIVGRTQIYLEGKKSAVRTRETHLTKIITDAVKKETGADVVFLNGGSFRSSINPGNITMNDVVSVSPFSNFIVTKKIKGSKILQMLELGLGKYPFPTGGFPQIAGMQCFFDPGLEFDSRVKVVKIDDVPMKCESEYIIATNDFISCGGDGYGMVKNCKEIKKYSELDGILARYFPIISPIGADNLSARIIAKI